MGEPRVLTDLGAHRGHGRGGAELVPAGRERGAGQGLPAERVGHDRHAADHGVAAVAVGILRGLGAAPHLGEEVERLHEAVLGVEAGVLRAAPRAEVGDQVADEVRQHVLCPPGAGREHLLHDVEEVVGDAVVVGVEVDERRVAVGVQERHRVHVMAEALKESAEEPGLVEHGDAACAGRVGAGARKALHGVGVEDDVGLRLSERVHAGLEHLRHLRAHLERALDEFPRGGAEAGRDVLRRLLVDPLAVDEVRADRVVPAEAVVLGVDAGLEELPSVVDVVGETVELDDPLRRLGVSVRGGLPEPPAVLGDLLPDLRAAEALVDRAVAHLALLLRLEDDLGELVDDLRADEGEAARAVHALADAVRPRAVLEARRRLQELRDVVDRVARGHERRDVRIGDPGLGRLVLVLDAGRVAVGVGPLREHGGRRDDVLRLLERAAVVLALRLVLERAHGAYRSAEGADVAGRRPVRGVARPEESDAEPAVAGGAAVHAALDRAEVEVLLAVASDGPEVCERDVVRAPARRGVLAAVVDEASEELALREPADAGVLPPEERGEDGHVVRVLIALDAGVAGREVVDEGTVVLKPLADLRGRAELRELLLVEVEPVAEPLLPDVHGAGAPRAVAPEDAAAEVVAVEAAGVEVEDGRVAHAVLRVGVDAGQVLEIERMVELALVDGGVAVGARLDHVAVAAVERDDHVAGDEVPDLARELVADLVVVRVLGEELEELAVAGERGADERRVLAELPEAEKRVAERAVHEAVGGLAAELEHLPLDGVDDLLVDLEVAHGVRREHAVVARGRAVGVVRDELGEHRAGAVAHPGDAGTAVGGGLERELVAAKEHVFHRALADVAVGEPPVGDDAADVGVGDRLALCEAVRREEHGDRDLTVLDLVCDRASVLRRDAELGGHVLAALPRADVALGVELPDEELLAVHGDVEDGLAILVGVREPAGRSEQALLVGLEVVDVDGDVTVERRLGHADGGVVRLLAVLVRLRLLGRGLVARLRDGIEDVVHPREELDLGLQPRSEDVEDLGPRLLLREVDYRKTGGDAVVLVESEGVVAHDTALPLLHVRVDKRAVAVDLRGDGGLAVHLVGDALDRVGHHAAEGERACHRGAGRAADHGAEVETRLRRDVAVGVGEVGREVRPRRLEDGRTLRVHDLADRGRDERVHRVPLVGAGRAALSVPAGLALADQLGEDVRVVRGGLRVVLADLARTIVVPVVDVVRVVDELLAVETPGLDRVHDELAAVLGEVGVRLPTEPRLVSLDGLLDGPDLAFDAPVVLVRERVAEVQLGAGNPERVHSSDLPRVRGGVPRPAGSDHDFGGLRVRRPGRPRNRLLHEFPRDGRKGVEELLVLAGLLEPRLRHLERDLHGVLRGLVAGERREDERLVVVADVLVAERVDRELREVLLRDELAALALRADERDEERVAVVPPAVVAHELVERGVLSPDLEELGVAPAKLDGEDV